MGIDWDRVRKQRQRDMLARMDVEIAWFYEHCPDPEGWLNGHGNSMVAVWDYLAEFGPKAVKRA
jgi:hypothetical protein